jgi:protease-4
VKRLAWVALATASGALAVACNGRPRTDALDPATKSASSAEAASDDPKAGEVVEFDLTRGIPESPSGSVLLPMPATRTYLGLVRDLEKAAQNEKAKAFFVRLGDTTIDWAHAEELGLAFTRLRDKSKKQVICHANGFDNATAWFAVRSCSRIWLSPAGDVDTVGIGAQVIYVKGVLDKFKVKADFLHMGKYKSAAESVTQEGPSEAAREALTSVLGSIRETWLTTSEESRKGKNLTAILEDGPWDAAEAKKRGLVDEIGYEDDAKRDATAIAKTKKIVNAFGGKKDGSSGLDVGEILRVIAGGDGATKKPHIVVLPAEGSISMGDSSLFSDSGITARAMQRTIRKLANDDTVKAVVLRIDSPGGSALASDLIWHELRALKEKKPLVTSVAGMAASGGYYMAVASTKIVAERTSIVGSIGVVGGKIVVDDALEEFGIHAETFPASKAEGAAARAAYLSPFEGWDDATREKVRRQMSQIYELFLSRVSEGRGLPVEVIRAVAEGRIWSGVQGQRLGLVDELGGLGRSLDIARQLAKLDADAPVRLESGGRSVLESFLGDGHDDDDDGEARAKAVAEATGHAQPTASLLNEVAAPLRPYIASFAPLLGKERIVLALPFAFRVR